MTQVDVSLTLCTILASSVWSDKTCPAVQQQDDIYTAAIDEVEHCRMAYAYC